MNTEELKMVMEALGRLSDTAGNAAQWWLVLHYGQRVFENLLVFGGIVSVVWIVASSIRRATVEGEEWAALGRRVARRMGGNGNAGSCSGDAERIDRILSTFETMARKADVEK